MVHCPARSTSSNAASSPLRKRSDVQRSMRFRFYPNVVLCPREAKAGAIHVAFSYEDLFGNFRNAAFIGMELFNDQINRCRSAVLRPHVYPRPMGPLRTPSHLHQTNLIGYLDPGFRQPAPSLMRPKVARRLSRNRWVRSGDGAVGTPRLSRARSASCRLLLVAAINAASCSRPEGGGGRETKRGERRRLPLAAACSGDVGFRVVSAFSWFSQAQHREAGRNVSLIRPQEHGGHHAYLEWFRWEAAHGVVLIGAAF
jgi:hypothetical protein